ncbi:MAG: geranylgeranylglycerol-phosphate geranylgeranyltransferase [Thermosynechococcaceae cyanobacterium]
MVSLSPKRVDPFGTVRAFAQLCRPTLSVLAAVASGLTIYELNPEAPGLLYLLTAIVLVGTTAGAFAINDYDDIEKDRINHPERPLPLGTLRPEHAWWAAVILFGVALLAAIPLGQLSWLLVAICFLLLWNYSAILNVSGILGNVVVATIVAALIFLASLVAGRPLAMLYPSAFLFGYILAKEIVWDIHDAVGDRNRNVYTIANTWGASSAFTIAWGLLVLLWGSVLVAIAVDRPTAIASLPMAHPLLFGICASIMLASFSLALRHYQREQTPATYTSLISLGRLGMIIGLIGLLGTAP